MKRAVTETVLLKQGCKTPFEAVGVGIKGLRLFSGSTEPSQITEDMNDKCLCPRLLTSF